MCIIVLVHHKHCQSYTQLFHKLSGKLEVCAWDNLVSRFSPNHCFITRPSGGEAWSGKKKKSIFFFVSQDKENMFEVMKMVDKANGYVYGKGEKTSLTAMMSTAVGAEFDVFKYPLQCWARH